jgi:hypothetical protein
VADISRELLGMPNPKKANCGAGLKAVAERLEIKQETTGPLCERNAILLRKVFLRMLELPC